MFILCRTQRQNNCKHDYLYQLYMGRKPFFNFSQRSASFELYNDLLNHLTITRLSHKEGCINHDGDSRSMASDLAPAKIIAAEEAFADVTAL